MYRKEDFVDESLNSETYCVPDGEYEFEIFDRCVCHESNVCLPYVFAQFICLAPPHLNLN